jgi:hypothetical protein
LVTGEKINDYNQELSKIKGFNLNIFLTHMKYETWNVSEVHLVTSDDVSHIYIYKMNDEYYLVHESASAFKRSIHYENFYICDQFDELISVIKSID